MVTLPEHPQREPLLVDGLLATIVLRHKAYSIDQRNHIAGVCIREKHDNEHYHVPAERVIRDKRTC